MTKLEAFKLAARIVVASGTTTVTNGIIRNNVAPANAFQSVSVAVASVVIGSMASEATRSHTDDRIDAMARVWNDSRSSDDETTVPAE